jgi:hypothetical protein
VASGHLWKLIYLGATSFCYSFKTYSSGNTSHRHDKEKYLLRYAPTLYKAFYWEKSKNCFLGRVPFLIYKWSPSFDDKKIKKKKEQAWSCHIWKPKLVSIKQWNWPLQENSYTLSLLRETPFNIPFNQFWYMSPHTQRFLPHSLFSNIQCMRVKSRG